MTASGTSHLMRARLTPRLSSPRPLPRTQIVERIHATREAKLVLVHGPAGFGKTTILMQYFAQLQQRKTAIAWLTVDSVHNDLNRFVTHVVSAVRAIDPKIASNPRRDGAAAAGDVDGATLDLVNLLSSLTDPFALFLDDFEEIKNQTVFELVRQIIRYLPEHGRLVIGSRTIPEIGLGRLRAHGELLEITTPQLRFTPEETASFLRHRCGLALSDDHVLRLQRFTEGWAAALCLASLALQDRGNPQQFIDTFDGANASIADYLLEDVLSRQPDHVRSFLMRTSVLKELGAELCNHVLGRDDSRELLSYVERSHLFLVPQDLERRWYRYHALFRSFLHVYLKQTSPDAVVGLHRLASDWYLSEGRPVPAIEHALLSRDVAHARTLLETHAEKLLWQGRVRLLARWFDSPVLAGQLKSSSKLSLVHVWTLTFIHRYPEAMALLEQMQATEDGGTGPERSTWAQVNVLHAFLLAMMDRLGEAAAHWRRCMGRVSAQEPFPFGILATSYADCLIAESRFKEAQDLLDKALQGHWRIGATFIVSVAICLEGAIDFAQGRLRSAVVRFRAGLASGTSETLRDVSGSAFSVAFLAEALYELNELDEAERLLNVYLPQIKEVAPPDQLITSFATLARIASCRGNPERAADILTDMESIGHQLATPRMVAMARLERSRTALFRGNVNAAEDYLTVAAEDKVWLAFEGFIPHANEIESPELARLRLDVRCGRGVAAIERLRCAVKRAEGLHRHRQALKLNILLAEALCSTGQQRMGMRRLREALQFASGEGFVRTFVDEGPSIIRLVAEFASTVQRGDGSGEVAGELAAFVDAVLAAGGVARVDRVAANASPVVCEAPAGTLSEREIQVLGLLASGRRNRSIADMLFVTESTVKSHLRSINVKLGSQSRTHAVAIARERGWIA
jgi:LuxR family maltose regulon positive regulatory protein